MAVGIWRRGLIVISGILARLGSRLGSRLESGIRVTFVLALMAAAGAVIAPAGSVAQTRFVEGMEDVPLMAGLTPNEAGSVAFDAPSGRIVVVQASGTVTRDQVIAFYATTLPQLGWARVAPSSFRREGEELKLEFPAGAAGGTGASGGRTQVRFSLSPAP